MNDANYYEDLLREAMMASDVEILGKLIADDLIFTGFNGQLFTKVDGLNMHRSGLIKIDKLYILDRHVRTFQSTEVVVTQVRISGAFNNEPASGIFRYTRVWEMKAEGWQIVVGQCTAVIP